MSSRPDPLRRVSAVTQAVSLLALTATGALVSLLARQAWTADALRAEQPAPVRPSAAPPQLTRPVRTVVVIRRVPAAPPRARTRSAGPRPAAPVVIRPAQPAPSRRTTTHSAPARTSVPPATTTSGS
jgi:hypothetical protein